MRQNFNYPLPAVSLTNGSEKQHFFGYYGKQQFDSSDNYVIAHQTDVIGRLQVPEDSVKLGVIDRKAGNRWMGIAESTAWNWQMGSLARWLPGNERKIIYNTRQQNCFATVIKDFPTGRQTILPGPFYEIAPDGRSALTLNFSRLWDVRPETGFCGIDDLWGVQTAPDGDGIFSMDLEDGATTLLISHSSMAELLPVDKKILAQEKWYFTHLLFNPGGARFMFWYRSWPTFRSFLCTASAAGHDIYILNDRNSHSTWLGDDRVLCWAHQQGEGRHTYLFTDQRQQREIFAQGQLEFNGHATFSPDQKWLITDKEPDEGGNRTLILYHLVTGRRFDIARLRTLVEPRGPLRCDLHPRWNQSGTGVCIDSTHEGSRQMYFFDLSDLMCSVF